MAVKKPPSGAGGPQPHPLVDRLTGAPDVSVLFGYPARDPQSGFWRIYQDLGFQSYLRVAEDDIVSTQTLATDEEPLRPSVVWVRRGADVEQTRVEARRLQAGFLQGPLVEGLGGFPLGAAARTRPAGLLTRDPEICSIDICRSRDFGGCFTRIRACVSEFGHCGGGGGGDTLGAFCPTREFVCGETAGCTFGPECGQ
jgi:hypothetical protein